MKYFSVSPCLCISLPSRSAQFIHLSAALLSPHICTVVPLLVQIVLSSGLTSHCPLLLSRWITELPPRTLCSLFLRLGPIVWPARLSSSCECAVFPPLPCHIDCADHAEGSCPCIFSLFCPVLVLRILTIVCPRHILDCAISICASIGCGCSGPTC